MEKTVEQRIAALEIRLAKARTQLVLKHIFLASVALKLKSIVDANVPTAQTNYTCIKYGLDFCEPLTDGQLVFLVAHEVMHVVLSHDVRLGNRDHQLFNIAADYVINQILVEDGVGGEVSDGRRVPTQFIEGGCLNPDIFKAGGGTTEGVYAYLLQELEGKGNLNHLGIGDASGTGDPGGTGMDIEPFNGTPEEAAAIERDSKIQVAQAAQAAKMAGKLSAGMERFIGMLFEATVDWREVLQRFMIKAKSDDRSWARPNRRFISQGMYLPSSDGEVMGEIAFAVDCSGSIGEKELTQFASEIYAVKESGNPKAIHIVYFDSSVSHYDKFTSDDDDLQIKPHGGGGTAFSPIFEYLTENDVDPQVCVVLTDLCCSDFGPEPDYPVLWVTNHSTEAPWGEVVEMKL